MKPLFVELFSGSAVLAKRMKSMGWDTLTIDKDPKMEADWVVDIMDIDPQDIADLNPTVIWAGVDCSCFSVLTISRYWNKDGTPKPENWGIDLLKKTVEIFEVCQPQFGIIENPRGMMRKQKILQEMNRYEICYCRYGDDVMKPTDLFGMLPPTFYPRMCFNGNKDCHHQKCGRGSSSGIQGRSNSFKRAMYPSGLVDEVAKSLDDWISEKVPSWWYMFNHNGV